MIFYFVLENKLKNTLKNMQAYIAKKSGTRKSATFPKGGVSSAGELMHSFSVIFLSA